MKLLQMIGAGVLTVAGGMFLAWSLDDRSVEASISESADNVVTLQEDDDEINSAQVDARATFDRFWTRVSTDPSGLDAISIKVAVPHAGGSEHLWMTGCASADAQAFDCVVSNEPVEVPLKLGTRYQFERTAISDWMYRQDGMIHGGYSIRVLLPTLPVEQADAMAAMLAPLPEG